MPGEQTYLELSEETGSAHKFYEVVVDGAKVSIRFGRIGDPGQVQTKQYASAEAAMADARKKIAEKVRKGYAPATPGVRQKRQVTHRQITSQPSTARHAPVLWKFATGQSAFGIFIDHDHCWVGNEAGLIYAVDHQGQVQRQFRMPEGIKCIVADDDWLYAGCDDGRVYDLSGKIPRVAYDIATNVDIYWLDIADGILGVSDANGYVTAINHEDESQWTRKSSGSGGWMVRCDAAGIYHGHSMGVTMYDWKDGARIWDRPTRGAVLFGWQERSAVYAGTADRSVYRFSKDGLPGTVYACDASIFSCATAEDGRYVFAGDSFSSVYCFEAGGRRLWKLGTGCGSAYSMQFLEDRLYIVTTDGALACIDASEAAIQAAQAGTVPQARDIKAPPPGPVVQPGLLETAQAGAAGVVLECYREGSQLRVRVLSTGYRPDWHVQFPRDLRQEGARYLVDEVRPAAYGEFYRAYGDIRRLG
jgi:outer membrane protein assembly factor BamB